MNGYKVTLREFGSVYVEADYYEPAERGGLETGIPDSTLNFYSCGKNRRVASFAPGEWIYVQLVDDASVEVVKCMTRDEVKEIAYGVMMEMAKSIAGQKE